MGGTPITSGARGEVHQAKIREDVPGKGKQVCTQRHKKHAEECCEVFSGVGF